MLVDTLVKIRLESTNSKIDNNYVITVPWNLTSLPVMLKSVQQVMTFAVKVKRLVIQLLVVPLHYSEILCVDIQKLQFLLLLHELD